MEGIEGVGKTTNIAFIRQYLEDAGKEVVVTREPGGTSVGEAIRLLLLDARQTRMFQDTELLLMFAARAQHISEIIRPALEANKWVVCDRFTDATYAYQGGGRGIAYEKVANLENWVQGDLRPDLTLLLDMPVVEGLARAGRRSKPDRFENEHIVFFEKVRDAYLGLVKDNPQRYRIVNGAQTLAKVQSEIALALKAQCL